MTCTKEERRVCRGDRRQLLFPFGRQFWLQLGRRRTPFPDPSSSPDATGGDNPAASGTASQAASGSPAIPDAGETTSKKDTKACQQPTRSRLSKAARISLQRLGLDRPER